MENLFTDLCQRPNFQCDIYTLGPVPLREYAAKKIVWNPYFFHSILLGSKQPTHSQDNQEGC